MKKPVIRDIFKQVISATSEETAAPTTICQVVDPDNGSVRLYIPVQQQQEVETEVSFVKESVLKVDDTCMKKLVPILKTFQYPKAIKKSLIHVQKLII